MGGSSECILVHRLTSSSICGRENILTARSGTGFGTSATSFSSTLSGTAIPSLNGTLVECFGPANSVDPGNRVASGTLRILGQYEEISSSLYLSFSLSLSLLLVTTL